MKMKKLVATVATMALLITPQLNAQALALKTDVDEAIAKQGFFFCDYNDGGLNTDRNDPDLGDEQRLVYLSDVNTDEDITAVRVGEEYILHCVLVNDGPVKGSLENVKILIGQGDNYDTLNLNAVITYGNYEDDSHGSIEFFSRYPIIDRSENSAADGWVRLKPVGKAKLYNHGGLLNGAQVNHRSLFAHSDTYGIYVGYNDQDGVLPYGKEYACEIRVRVRLEAEDNWFWSDPIYNGQYTGRTIENGQLVDVKQ